MNLMRRWMAVCLVGFGVSAAAGCARSPSPTWPIRTGSIGLPHRGVLQGGVELPLEGNAHRFLRKNDRHFALPRFADVLVRSAEAVQFERPGPRLVVGDLSTRSGGQLLPHLSHRSGRDADLLLFAMTVEGAPVESPGFVHFGADGLGWDETGKRFLRFDVAREWILVKALLENPDARVQWIFVSDVLACALLDWAHSLGESAELIERAATVMAQPRPGGVHDDHIHVRTGCSPEDRATGCEPSGPERPWLVADDDRLAANDRSAPAEDDTADLVAYLLTPRETPPVGGARQAKTTVASRNGRNKPETGRAH